MYARLFNEPHFIFHVTLFSSNRSPACSQHKARSPKLIETLRASVRRVRDHDAQSVRNAFIGTAIMWFSRSILLFAR